MPISHSLQNRQLLFTSMVEWKQCLSIPEEFA